MKKNANIVTKIALVTGFILALVMAACLSFAIYRLVQTQIADNTRINTAGRLRMLSQKITKQTLLFRDGVVSRHEVETPVTMFNDSIHAITEGGIAPLTMGGKESMVLPPMDDPESRRMLDQAVSQWEPFERSVMDYLAGRNKESLAYMLSRNEALIDILDRSVLAIQNRADRDQKILGVLIGGAIALILMGIVAGFVRQMRKYREASALLAEFERLLPICAGCKKIRTDDSRPFDPSAWISVEAYLREHKDMTFTHSLCPDCMMKYDPEGKGD